MSLSDIQFSHFDPTVHSYVPHRQTYLEHQVHPGLRLAGPMVLEHHAAGNVLAAYEHGSLYPDTFLDFCCQSEDGGWVLSLAAVNGNYYDGQIVSAEDPFVSVWFQLGNGSATAAI